MTEEELQGEWTYRVPEFTATKVKVADQSEGRQCPLCLFSVSVLNITDWSQAVASQALKQKTEL